MAKKKATKKSKLKKAKALDHTKPRSLSAKMKYTSAE
jgi:hypothetical protein